MSSTLWETLQFSNRDGPSLDLLEPRIGDVDYSAEKRRQTLHPLVANCIVGVLEGEEPDRLPVDDLRDGAVVLNALGPICC